MSEALDGGDAQATIEAWRASGVQRLDPVRFAFIEALARRAQAHQGEVRQLLDGKLAAAIQAYARRIEAAGGVPARAPGGTGAPSSPRSALARPAAAPKRPPGPLAELVRLLAPAAAGPRTAPELKALRVFRRSWTRRNSEQQLVQSQAVLPENAGPLHSQALVLRALQLMQGLSPEYLVRFMAHAETLLWLEQAHGASLPAPRNVVRPSAPPAAPAAPAARKTRSRWA